jgi:hypothetical protein
MIRVMKSYGCWNPWKNCYYEKMSLLMGWNMNLIYLVCCNCVNLNHDLETSLSGFC